MLDQDMENEPCPLTAGLSEVKSSKDILHLLN